MTLEVYEYIKCQKYRAKGKRVEKKKYYHKFSQNNLRRIYVIHQCL